MEDDDGSIFVVHGNKESANMETVLKQNILNSEYYRNSCTKLLTWAQIIDEVYETVQVHLA